MTIRINRVYTRSGDQGETSLASGQRVPKDALRIESYGTVDELNAVLGVARVANRDAARSSSRLDAILGRLQNELFDLGADLATLPKDRHPKQPVIEEADVTRLEALIDELNEGLPELRSFILPGGGLVAAHLHVARTVCRRAERVVTALARQEEIGAQSLIYLNRLSDLLFVLSRWAAREAGEAEILWEPKQSGRGS
jgi:cob(I)alamin adenosyltransferase